MSYIYERQFKFGYTLRVFLHSHPNGGDPSGLNYTEKSSKKERADIQLAERICNDTGQSPLFCLYFPKTRQWLQYTQYSKKDELKRMNVSN